MSKPVIMSDFEREVLVILLKLSAKETASSAKEAADEAIMAYQFLSEQLQAMPHENGSLKFLAFLPLAKNITDLSSDVFIHSQVPLKVIIYDGTYSHWLATGDVAHFVTKTESHCIVPLLVSKNSLSCFCSLSGTYLVTPQAALIYARTAMLLLHGRKANPSSDLSDFSRCR